MSWTVDRSDDRVRGGECEENKSSLSTGASHTWGRPYTAIQPTPEISACIEFPAATNGSSGSFCTTEYAPGSPRRMVDALQRTTARCSSETLPLATTGGTVIFARC